MKRIKIKMAYLNEFSILTWYCEKDAHFYLSCEAPGQCKSLYALLSASFWHLFWNRVRLHLPSLSFKIWNEYYELSFD